MNWICWGSNSYGEGDTPAFFKERKVAIITASIGRHYLCLIVRKLGTTQTLHCWGNDEHGQILIPDEAAEQADDVSAGDQHTCVVQGLTKHVCFGFNSHGQLNIPDDIKVVFLVSRNLSTCFIYDEIMECIGKFEFKKREDDLQNKIYLFQLGQDHLCTVLKIISCYGSNEFGQTTIPASIEADIDLYPLSKFHTYANHNCASFSNILICWGQNEHGQVDKKYQDQPQTQSEAVTGLQHTCALMQHYLIKCWGSAKQGAIEFDPKVNEFIQLFTASSDFTCIVKKAKVKCQGKYEKKLNKVPDILQNKIELLKSGFSHNCAIQNNSTSIQCWGVKEPKILNPPIDSKPNSIIQSQVSAGFKFSCVFYDNLLLDKSMTTCFGINDSGTLDIPSHVEVLSKVITLSSGLEHSCVISDQLTLHCWGSNKYQQLNIPPIFLCDVVMMTTGWQHTCACLESLCMCWGNNLNGQSDIPDNVKNKSGLQVQAGGSHSCGVDTDIVMVCWGSNQFGQLKPIRSWQGTYSNVELGLNHTCVSNSSGKVRCQGDDSNGQVSFE